MLDHTYHFSTKAAAAATEFSEVKSVQTKNEAYSVSLPMFLCPRLTNYVLLHRTLLCNIKWLGGGKAIFPLIWRENRLDLEQKPSGWKSF